MCSVLTLHVAGRESPDGSSPTASDRLSSLLLGHRLLGHRLLGPSRALLLFDELEDLFDAHPLAALLGDERRDRWQL